MFVYTVSMFCLTVCIANVINTMTCGSEIIHLSSIFFPCHKVTKILGIPWSFIKYIYITYLKVSNATFIELAY